jgi:pimeloyl-ACP methyl ester carboxylesterase
LLAAGMVSLIASAAFAQGRPPVIFVPGLLGSELVNKNTGQKVWFKTRRVKTDDISLPIGPDLAANRDALVPGDVIRDAKSLIFPRQDVYGRLIDYLQTRGGYREANWDNPPERGYEDTLYLFSYDWRRDIVETSRLLIRRIESLKQKLGRPDLKFNIVAHSMGGLVARYAAMYGDSDLPADGSVPVLTWAGAKHIEKIILIAPPNEGAVRSLDAIVNGFDITGLKIKLPYVRRLSKFDIFTIPTAYELLPAPGVMKAIGDDLKPVRIDLYDQAVWNKYGWNVIEDRNFRKHFTAAEQRNAKSYFLKVLDRAKRLHEALAPATARSSPVIMSLIGAGCRGTPGSVVLYQKKDSSWTTLFEANGFRNADGRKISSSQLAQIIYVPGDGIVTLESLTAENVSKRNGSGFLSEPALVCEDHDKLPGNLEVQALISKFLESGE